MNMLRTIKLQANSKHRLIAFSIIAVSLFILLYKPLMQLCLLAIQAFEITLPGYNPVTFAKTYFLSGSLERFATGLFALFVTLVIIIGLPHILINLTALWLDFKGFSNFSSLKLIVRQRRCEKKYFRALSRSESKITLSDTHFNDEERLEVHRLISEAKRKDRFIFEDQIRKWIVPKRKKISTISQALAHLFFSYDSFTRSAYFYTKVWNAWFSFRAFFPLFHPLLTLTRILYPNFFRVATSQDFQRTVPSKLNGGLRPVWAQVAFRIFAAKKYRHLKHVDAVVLKSETLLRSLAEPLMGDFTIRFWETMVLNQKDPPSKLNLSPTEAQAIVELAKQNYSAGDRRTGFDRLLDRVLSRIDPASRREVQIIQIANRQLKNPRAMARAVRSMIASNFVDKPIELIFLFASYAIIEEGILRPIHETMFDSETWFYLSRYVFFNGFIYSVIAGVFSDTWLKIQQDFMNEEKFGQVPCGVDAKKSFMRWYLEQTFFRKDNSFLKNQSYAVMNYILPTLKATFVTAFIVNLITMGRFDLDVFIAQTLVLIFLPFTGLSWKLEQGFELASSWVMRHFPEKLRAHPAAQAYAQSSIAWRRLLFNFFYKIWDCLSWNFAVAFMTMNTVEFGTRSFSRIIFGGYTPTELVANGLRNYQVALHSDTFFAHVIQFVDKILTHNYTDGTKLIF